MSPWELVRRGFDHNQVYCETESVPTHVRDRVKDVFELLESESLFEVFVNPVDYYEVPIYLPSIPYPMCMKLVYERLTHGFYRRDEVTLVYV